MLDGETSHRHRTLDHDPIDEAVLDALDRVRQVIECEHLYHTLAVGEFLLSKDLGDCGTADLADTKDALEIRIGAKQCFGHRDPAGEVVFGAFGSGDRDLRVGFQRLLHAGDAFVEVRGAELAGHDGNLALAADGLCHRLAHGLTGGFVDRADIHAAAAIGAVAVKRENGDAGIDRLLDDTFDGLRLVDRNCDAVYLTSDQVLDDLDLG